MADFLANPVDIRFSSMPFDLAAPAANPADIDNTAAVLVQQSDSDLLAETHPPTPRELRGELDHVTSMMTQA